VKQASDYCTPQFGTKIAGRVPVSQDPEDFQLFALVDELQACIEVQRLPWRLHCCHQGSRYGNRGKSPARLHTEWWG
jgi:hypothetical protein